MKNNFSDFFEGLFDDTSDNNKPKTENAKPGQEPTIDELMATIESMLSGILGTPKSEDKVERKEQLTLPASPSTRQIHKDATWNISEVAGWQPEIKKPKQTLTPVKSMPVKAKDTHVETPPARQRTVVSARRQGSMPSGSENVRKRVSDVYVGIDFGTTFTKAAYEVSPSNVQTKYSVRFGHTGKDEDYYLPSVVYFNPKNNTMTINNPGNGCEAIRYFKYNMISDALQKNVTLNNSRVQTKHPKEQLCSVFYLSYVIGLVRDSVEARFNNGALSADSKWYINIGVPLEAHKDNQEARVYKKVLEIAYLLDRESHGMKYTSLKALDDFFDKHERETNDRINTLPEIYAEVLLYQQYLNAPAGFYTVIDIGGGTADIATFLKTAHKGTTTIECLQQNVIPYGYDAVSERITKILSRTNCEEARRFLSRDDLDFNDDADLKAKLPRIIDLNRIIDVRKECRALVGTCLQKARMKKTDVLEKTMKNEIPMHIFVMGGANKVPFYLNAVEHMKVAQKYAGIPFIKDDDVFAYLDGKNNLEIRNDQRLVISQMLAQPYEMVPEITNMPWDLKEESYAVQAPDLQHIMDERYGV